MTFFINTKGTISVLLLLLAVPMIMFAGLLIDASRLSSAKSQIMCAQQLSTDAALSCYDTELEKRYGLFAMSKDEKAMEKNTESYFKETIEGKGKGDNVVEMSVGGYLFNYNIDCSLSSCVEFEKQIDEYMKYRAPVNLTKGILIKAAAISGLDKSSKVIDALQKYNSKVSELEPDFKAIYKAMIDYNASPTRAAVASLKEILAEFEEKAEDTDSDGEVLSKAIGKLSNSSIKDLFSNEYESTQKILGSKSTESISQSLDSLEVLDNDNALFSYLEEKYTNQPDEGDGELKIKLESFSEKENEKKEAPDTCVSSLINSDIIKAIDAGNPGNSLSADISTLSNIEKNIKDNYYAEEYINMFFDCMTDESGVPETEYIIFGKDNYKDNANAAKDLIFAVRFTLNCIYAFTNPGMRSTAVAAAVAISGWTGICTPAVTDMILAAWAAAETAVDMDSLLKGKRVAVYKSENTWSLGINGISETLLKKAEEIAIQSVDELFDTLSEIPLTQTDKLYGVVVSYADKIAEAAADEAKTRVNNMLTGVFKNTTQPVKDSINSKIKELSLDGESVTEKISIYTLEYIRDNLCEKVENTAYTTAEEKIDAIQSSINEYVENLASEYAEGFKKQIKGIIDNETSNVKQKITFAAEEYMNKMSSYVDTSGNTAGNLSNVSATGLSLTYREYLQIFTLIGMTDRNIKTGMEKRAMKIIQINMSESNAEFDITKAYTAVHVETKTAVKTNFFAPSGTAKVRKIYLSSELDDSYRGE